MSNKNPWVAPNTALAGEAGIPLGALRFVRDEHDKKVLQMWSFNFDREGGAGCEWITVPLIKEEK